MRAHYDAFERFYRALLPMLPLRGTEPWAVQANALLRPITDGIAAHPEELRTHPVLSATALIVLFFLNQDPNLGVSFQDIWQRFVADKGDLSVITTILRLTRILDDLAPTEELAP